MAIQVHNQADNIVVDDQTLVRRCRQGDSSAMHRLILKYQDRIYNVTLKICGNRDDAAELTQETFVKVIENIDKFRGKSAFYTWLFRIAVNLTYNFCRRKVKLHTRSLSDSPGHEPGGAAAQLGAFLADEKVVDPAILAHNKEVAEIIQRALGWLDEDQRVIIVLRDIEGMTYAQMAKALDIEIGTVKSRLSRARAGLREILEVMLK